MLDLGQFMERVGATDEDVAGAIECDRTTVSRIRRRRTRPDAETLLLINRWAADVAKKKRLPKTERLWWDWIVSSKAG
ncbi:MAG TPA: hypothetical protein VGB13_12280 [Candidatus Krumholzibacteria bacterium]